jgi:hypothetical protein
MRNLIERDDGMPIGDLREMKARFALTQKEIEVISKALGESAAVAEGIAAELNEQKKLLEQLGKIQNPANPPQGIDADRIGRMIGDLARAREYLKKETEKLRQEVEAARKQ